MANGNGDFPPSIRVARLFQKKSKAGAVYFQGRWGGAKVALVKTKDVGDGGEEIWSLLFSEAPAQQKTDDKSTAASAPAGYSGVPRGNHPGVPDADIPFMPEWR